MSDHWLLTQLLWIVGELFLFIIAVTFWLNLKINHLAKHKVYYPDGKTPKW
jgi:hypothetical protein